MSAPYYKPPTIGPKRPDFLKSNNEHSVSVPSSSLSSGNEPPKGAVDKTGKKKSKYVRAAGGQVWEDPTLAEWDPNDYRIFCGDLGNDVNDEVLTRTFNRYPSFVKARVVRDKHTNKSKGYGFISFKEPNDFIRAMREMDGKGNTPEIERTERETNGLSNSKKIFIKNSPALP
ncbi:RNA-binding protein 42, partial [Fragariocoptes setiger]